VWVFIPNQKAGKRNIPFTCLLMNTDKGWTIIKKQSTCLWSIL